MLGLIKKDLLMVKANYKVLIIYIAIIIMMNMQNQINGIFILPFMGVMLIMGTFGYDEYNNWNAYVTTLPNGRKNSVRAKYLSSIIISVIASVICLIILFANSYMQNDTGIFYGSLKELLGTFVGMIMAISFMYPIIYKFGMNNARIWMLVFLLAILGIAEFLPKPQGIDETAFVTFLNNYGNIVVPVIVIIVLTGSYLISSIVYKNKEF